jgi:superfamily II DNA or RNA helicase
MLRDYEFQDSYSVFSDQLYLDFLQPCFENSILYRRASGYFSSTIFALGPMAFTEYFEKGGRVQLICSPHFSSEDQEAVKNADAVDSRSLAEVWSDSINKTSDSEFGKLTSRFLAALIRNDYLELRIARFTAGNGLFHDKLGIFSDEQGDVLSFIGSANETLSAWSGVGNHESIDAFKSWLETGEKRVLDHENRFHSFWEGEAQGLEVLSGEEAAQSLLEAHDPESLSDLAEELRTKVFKQLKLAPKRPQPRDYQQQAIDNWIAAGHRGVISFATGGGKTLTALHCANTWLSGDRACVVLLPSSILVSQWMTEIKQFYPTAQVLRADSHGLRGWKKLLGDFLKPNPLARDPRFVLATYSGAQRKNFRQELQKFQNNTLIIGDEVHKFGALESRKIAEEYEPAARLGLSATPLRKRDDEGTDAIYGFFGDQLKPIYTLQQAIEEGNLSPYKFDFQDARLTPEEQATWDEYSSKIRKLMSKEDLEGGGRISPELERLLIARARVAKLAEQKVKLAAKQIIDTFEEGDRYLAYCETGEHVDALQGELTSLGAKMTVMTYLASNEEEHERVMEHFSNHGGLIIAIRCLDEGVDIPAINKAVILSSSQSPREFIQRRGRLLRKYPGKVRAELFDFLTLRSTGEKLQDGEFERLKEFAVDASNPDVRMKLAQLDATLEGSLGDSNE